MKTTGKILFFNVNDGKGIVMTQKKEKLSFSVEDWDDFEVMPSLGLEVAFWYENSLALKITTLDNWVDDDEELEADEEESYDAEDSAGLEDDETPEEEEEDKEHFEKDRDINELSLNMEIEDEIGEREESVTVTLNLSNAVRNYFDIIKENIEKRESYTKAKGRLNYFLVRRFLWTTFNNLSEIDLHIITPEVKAQSNDLRAMEKIYNDFMTKIKYPPLAYEEVFLSCQAEYMKIKTATEKTVEQLNHLKGSEKHVGGVLKIKKEELSKNVDTQEFDILQGELKSMNGTYVDIVHMMAELDERYKHDMQLLKEFEKEYRDDFYELFNEAAGVYKKQIIDILSAQSFMLDAKLWEKSKKSKALKAHFHKAGITGEFNTKTYLKYYLDSQDSTKVTGDNKKLFELYEYLSSLHKDCIMIVMTSAQDAMEYESNIKNVDKEVVVKSFINEILALKWAMKNSVKVLVLEDRLAKINAETFLTYYKKYILVIPKIIILGNSTKSEDYSISKLLSSNISSKALGDNIKELLKEK